MSTSTGTKTGILGVGVIGAALVCLGGASPGAPTASPTPTAKTSPGDLMKPVIAITGVSGAGDFLDVEVMNTTPSTDETTVHFRGKATPFKPTAKGNTKVRVSAEWGQYVPFCELGTYAIHLTGNATVDTRERTVAFTSTFLFTASGSETKLGAAAIPGGPTPEGAFVGITGGQLKTGYKCGSKLAAEVTVNNGTALAAQHLRLTLKDLTGATLAEVPFQLGAHSKRNVLVETTNNVSGRSDVMGHPYRITISDDANELGGKLLKDYEYDIAVAPSNWKTNGAVTARLVE